MFRSLVQAVVNLVLVLAMALFTLPALGLLWLASIPAGYLKRQTVHTPEPIYIRTKEDSYAGGL